MLMEMNRTAEAGEKFRRVLEIESDNAEAHFRLGDLAERSGNDADAIMQFDIVFRLDPAYPGVRRRLSALMLERSDDGDREAARKLLEEEHESMAPGAADRSVAERDDDDMEGLGLLLLDAGCAGRAISTFRVLTTNRPEHARDRKSVV